MEIGELGEFIHMCLHAGEFVLIIVALLIGNSALKRPKFNVKQIVKDINSMQLGTGSKD